MASCCCRWGKDADPPSGHRDGDAEAPSTTIQPYPPADLCAADASSTAMYTATSSAPTAQATYPAEREALSVCHGGWRALSYGRRKFTTVRNSFHPGLCSTQLQSCRRLGRASGNWSWRDTVEEIEDDEIWGLFSSSDSILMYRLLTPASFCGSLVFTAPCCCLVFQMGYIKKWESFWDNVGLWILPGFIT